MRIPLAKYGIKELIVFGIPCVVGIGVSVVAFPWIVPVPLFFFAFLLNFFRDPDRKTPQGAGFIIAPADGTVSHIVTVFEENYLKCHATKISIFMSVLDVHVNRVPVHSRIEFIQHTSGKFLDARDDECFRSNDRYVSWAAANRHSFHDEQTGIVECNTDRAQIVRRRAFDLQSPTGPAQCITMVYFVWKRDCCHIIQRSVVAGW